MSEWWWSAITELRQSFRIADAFDIALIALLLYTVLVWFRTTASRSLAIGVSVLAALYVLARAFDLYLTLLVFHGAFAVMLVMLVVVFQEDLRRMLERLAGWGSLAQLTSPAQSHPEINTIVESVFRLAETRTGALIVLKGREPLARQLDGGISLDGRLSKPLLYSIFDSSSPGHDGAVVIAEGRLRMFGAHLPISKNHAEIRGRGTRHSAGLGLSEQSDAMIIVVSEERGVVSIAEAGKLSECRNASELKESVEDFLDLRFPKTTTNATRQFLLRHWQLKLVAAILAVLAWFTLAYQPGTIQRTFAAPVEYRNVPAGLLVDSLASTEARVTLSGQERGFRFFDPATLKITIDLAGSRAGVLSIPVTDKEVRVPTNLSIYRIEPRRLYVPLREHRVEPPVIPAGSTPRP